MFNYNTHTDTTGSITLRISLMLLLVALLAFTPTQKAFSQTNAPTAIDTTTRQTELNQVDNTPDTARIDTAALRAMKLAKAKRHSPLKAALFSAAVPGLGQAYNKKYWKIPIVYAGLGGLGYAVYYTASNFIGYRAAYRKQVALIPDPYASYKGVDDVLTLKEYRDYFKKNLDVSAICTGVWYLLNIVDAAVDAHLFEWNMKNDLSVSWNPTMIAPAANTNSAAAGIKLTMHF